VSQEIVIRRSVLTVPGHMPRMLERAAGSDADEVMADCEDACPLSAKGDEVRRVIAEALNSLDWGSKFVTFRPNNTQSPYFEGDLQYVVRHAVDRFHGIILPKVFEPAQIELVDALLTEHERASGWTRTIRVEALIETALGVENAYRIATASQRMAGLCFGIADYAADVGIADAYTDQNVRFLFAKQRVVNAAKAAGLDALDNVHLQIRDLDALRLMSGESAGYGFDGRWAIHPSHIPVINEAYTPSEEQIDRATKVVAFYEEADAAGRGALVDPETGEMIDEASIKLAFKQLLKAYKAGKVTADFMRRAARSASHTGYNFLGVAVPQA
jgi:citrate lyase subunit beta/citryl-CoA lyase